MGQNHCLLLYNPHLSWHGNYGVIDDELIMSLVWGYSLCHTCGLGSCFKGVLCVCMCKYLFGCVLNKKNYSAEFTSSILFFLSIFSLSVFPLDWLLHIFFWLILKKIFSSFTYQISITLHHHQLLINSECIWTFSLIWLDLNTPDHSFYLFFDLLIFLYTFCIT